MNNDFLSEFRQTPRPEFTRSLYTRLTQDVKAGPSISRHTTAKRIGFALAGLCLLFALVMAVSPAARAAVESLIEKITVGGTTVLIEDEPLAVPTGESASYDALWTPISPKDISTNYSFYAKLPTWVPSGYVLQDRAALYYSSMIGTTPSNASNALFEWKDNAGGTIQLQVFRGACPYGPLYDPARPYSGPRADCTFQSNFIAGSDSDLQEITVNKQPGIIFSGPTPLADLSGPVQKWNPSRWKIVSKGTVMDWGNNERTFIIYAESTTTTREDLIRLAESIP